MSDSKHNKRMDVDVWESEEPRVRAEPGYGLSERTVNLINNNVADPDTAKLLVGSVGGGLSALTGAASLTCSAFIAINLINGKKKRSTLRKVLIGAAVVGSAANGADALVRASDMVSYANN